ncbi:MAG: aminotransferase class IV [Planctomycetota bacterium]|jgi:branched-chain amino acid aminotransferase|nr:aminotransferase class IV [Planctomycetota bacterium]MDA1026489.1 aminotransferase class IV [Planctomycetota bacterium]
MTAVWLNGILGKVDDTRVSAFDAGFQHAVGLFETMMARGPRIVHLNQHLDRLEVSLRETRLSDRLKSGPLAEAIHATVAAADLEIARVRLTITGGDLNLLHGGGDGHEPTILIVAQPATAYPAELYEKGIRATVADARANPLDPFAAHKTLAYWPRLAELQSAAAKNASEALWFTVSNHLAGGCVSNVILVKDGDFITPIVRGEEPEGGLSSPVLPGVVRAEVLGWAAGEGRLVQRKMIDINAVLEADEVLLTNSSWGVLPVVGVEREQIGEGVPGPVASSLRAWWLAE